MYKNLYKFIYIEQKAQDNIQIYWSLERCGPWVWKFQEITFWHLEFGSDSPVLSKIVDLWFDC